MIACWECRNLERFVQVSARGDARQILQTSGQGLHLDPFEGSDNREPGLYCAMCAEAVEGDAETLGLSDGRIDFIRPDSFDADGLARELRAIREHAAWTELRWPAQAPRHRDLSVDLSSPVRAALERTGRLPLYTHQAEAIDASIDGSHVVQATPAGSGKSLGFVVPVLERLVTEPESTAIMVFPLRALANDQLNGLARLGVDADPWVSKSVFDLHLVEGAVPIRVARYDGATEDYERPGIRRDARLIIATPDMLHQSVLRMALREYKDKTSWRRLLRGLSYVVLDEIHSYQGVFGSNVAHVLRRLRRVAALLDSRPQFLAASATIGNPVELAEELTGVRPFRLVDDDGSGRRSRVVLICNPPLRSDAASTKAMATKKGATTADPAGESAVLPSEIGRIAPQTIAIDLVTHGALAAETHLPVRTIVFAGSRNAVFQLTQRIRGAVREARRPELEPTVAPYAATFLSDDRVAAEGKLRDGSTLAVVSTSALELGIDIPDLSLAILVGYPGQISSFRQRAGRVGRSGEGLAILIVGDDPLQQWIARDPEALQRLLEARAEDVVVNAGAVPIAERFGLAPAQAELGGIAFEDREFFGDIVDEWLADAKGPPAVERKGVPYWMVETVGDPYADLRSASGGSSVSVFKVDRRNREPIGVIDRGSAPRDCFVPAIWTGSDGELYRVIGFDEKEGEVHCEGPINAAHQTRGVTVDRPMVDEPLRPTTEAGLGSVGYGALSITRHVFSYKEQHFSGVERSLPVEKGWAPMEFQTDGVVVDLGPLIDTLPGMTDGAVRAVEHLLLAVAPALIACDPYDLDATTDKRIVYLYDAFGGGLRLSETLYDRFQELAALAHQVVATCECDSGCPGCVMLSRRPDGNRDLSKAGAATLLAALQPG